MSKERKLGESESLCAGWNKGHGGWLVAAKAQVLHCLLELFVPVPVVVAIAIIFFLRRIVIILIRFLILEVKLHRTSMHLARLQRPI
jgi:hypothetical protein